MVVQKIKDLNVKKVKMAKQVLAVFEIFGIDESILDELITLREYKKNAESEISSLEKRIEDLEKFKIEMNRTIENRDKAPTVSLQTEIEKTFKNKVEEFNPNAQ